MRPRHLLQKAAHGERAGADEGREVASAQFAQKCEHEDGAQKTIDREIFMEKAWRKHAIPVKWRESENQMQRVPAAGLGFAGEGAASERVRIPEREMTVPDGSQPEVQPGIGLVDSFRTDQRGVLIGEKRLPVEDDDGERQIEKIASRGLAHERGKTVLSRRDCGGFMP